MTNEKIDQKDSRHYWGFGGPRFETLSGDDFGFNIELPDGRVVFMLASELARIESGMNTLGLVDK